MEDLRVQQIEALQVAVPYCKKIINAINNLIGELTEERKEDTDEYMNSILNGINWIFEVYNGTRDFINEDGVIVDKEEVNANVVKLNEANTNNDDDMRAEAFKGIKEFIELFSAEAEKKIAD